MQGESPIKLAICGACPLSLAAVLPLTPDPANLIVVHLLVDR